MQTMGDTTDISYTLMRSTLRTEKKIQTHNQSLVILTLSHSDDLCASRMQIHISSSLPITHNKEKIQIQRTAGLFQKNTFLKW